MRSITRLVLLWLLALALPAQGAAAAAGLHCAADTAAAIAVGVHTAHHVDEAHGAHVAHHAGYHGAMAAEAPGHAPAQHHHPAAGSTGCSACAACCGAMALPSMPLLHGAGPAAADRLAPAALPAAVFLTGGPERPPRSIRL